jgi:hypothetical protein
MLRRLAVSPFEPTPENFARARAQKGGRDTGAAPAAKTITAGQWAALIVDLGGKCRRVDITCSIDEAGNVMAGSWVSQWPGSGTFLLTKQPKPP